MVGMKTHFIALALIAPFATAFADSDGQITLPYSQFARLTAQPAPPTPAQPPVKSALTRADYHITIGADGRALVRVDWQAENFSDTWAWVAVAPLDLAIEPDAQSTLVSNQAEIRLMMETPGIHRASATFPANSSFGVAAKFPVVPATFTSIRIEGPAAANTWRIDSASTIIDADGQVRHLLPATANEIVVRREEPQPDPQKPEAWNVTAEAWVEYDAGWLDHQVRLTATPPGTGGSVMRLDFPDMPSRIELSSDGLDFQEQTHGGFLLQWESRSARERTLTLRYRIQINGDHADWLPRLPEASATTVVLAIPQGAEIAGGGWLPDPSPARMPTWLREKAHSQSVLLQSGKLTAANVKWLPRVETDAITITEATISTRVVANGSQLTTASYQLAHSAIGSAQWSLPENMTLLEARISGQRATPIDRGDAIEFALPAPAGDKRPTVIEFSYTGIGQALDRVAGGLVVESPSTPLFAHRIDWTIMLPDGTRLDAVESNAEAAPAPASAPPGAAFLRRLLTRGEPLRAEVFYRSLNSEN
jgi:hypothetical protein